DPTSGSPQFEEGNGLGTGLRISFDIYNNGYFGNAENPPAPSVDVRYGNQLIASAAVPLSFMESGTDYGDAIVQLNTDGTLNVVYRGVVVFNNLPLPSFTSISGGSFAVVARSGGLNENVSLDNFQLTP